MAARKNQLSGTEVAQARESRGWSQAKLADLIGVRQNTIAQIELGRTKKSRYLPDIQRVLDDPTSGLNEAGSEAVTIISEQPVGKRDLPLFAAVEAGDGMLVMGSDPFGKTERPAALADVSSGYGLIVVGESMVPVLRPGDTVFVHPHLPPRPQDVVIFVSERAHGEVWATIKEYLGQTKDFWKVKRYRPKEIEFTLKKSEWRVHGIGVGTQYRR